MLINLVSNATKFTSSEGTIKIETTLLEADRLLRVDVIDTGIGIEDGKKDELFKLFGCIKDEKEKVNSKGIGLGLAISRLIVLSFDGEINFESTYGLGSRFSFTFRIFSKDQTLSKQG